jgi:hypothetical protein
MKVLNRLVREGRMRTDNEVIIYQEDISPFLTFVSIPRLSHPISCPHFLNLYKISQYSSLPSSSPLSKPPPLQTMPAIVSPPSSSPSQNISYYLHVILSPRTTCGMSAISPWSGSGARTRARRPRVWICR